MSGAVFIAGTDTGIGKTHAACSLLHALRAAGHDACGMKPVASGCAETPDGLRNDDALALQAASGNGGSGFSRDGVSAEPGLSRLKPLPQAVPPYALVNPVALRDPLSPHLAAAHDGTRIELAPMRIAFDELCAAHRHVVVEGIGGWLVPLAPGLFASDIARHWRLPVILVVGLRLGCLNHALLSARAIAADGCELLGWIGNRVDPAMDAVEENLATLRELLPAPCLGVLPHGLAPARAAGQLAAAVAALESRTASHAPCLNG